MTGKLLVKGPDHETGRHDHLVIRQTKRSLDFRDARMFGALKFDSGGEPDWWMKLPPEVVSRGFTAKVVRDYLRRRKGSPLKAVLSQQERFPGVANKMADEILRRCRLHPGRKADGSQWPIWSFKALPFPLRIGCLPKMERSSKTLILPFRKGIKS